MNLQLDPASVQRRAHDAARPVAIPCLGESVLRGMLGFTFVSVAGFAPWAGAGGWFYRNVGELGLYLCCAVVFIALSGPLLHRLIIGPGSLSRFYKLFALSFSLYAVLWMAGWMLLRGHPGSIAGLLGGTAVMGFLLAQAFHARELLLKTISALFLLNSAGYFLGGVVEGYLLGLEQFAPFGTPLPKRTHALMAKLLWGVFYGLGFGAGLGAAFYFLQEKTRALLRSSPPPP